MKRIIFYLSTVVISLQTIPLIASPNSDSNGEITQEERFTLNREYAVYCTLAVRGERWESGNLLIPAWGNSRGPMLGLRTIVESPNSPQGWVYMINKEKSVQILMHIEQGGKVLGRTSFFVGIDSESGFLQIDLDGDGNNRDAQLYCFVSHRK